MTELKMALKKFNIPDSQETLEKFRVYMERVLEWNEKVNLTAITDKNDFIRKHFIDSLCCLADGRFISSASVVDVGTGAGFPGLPLAIVCPEKKFLLIDSLNKRIRILNEIIGELGLENVTAIHGRAEELARRDEYREAFDICVSRAVSRMSVLSEYCLPFIRIGGYLAAYKGPDAGAEMEEAAGAVRRLGGKADGIFTTEMTEFDINHNIVFIKKVKSTPKAYPRKAGTPEKNPLK